MKLFNISAAHGTNTFEFSGMESSAGEDNFCKVRAAPARGLNCIHQVGLFTTSSFKKSSASMLRSFGHFCIISSVCEKVPPLLRWESDSLRVFMLRETSDFSFSTLTRGWSLENSNPRISTCSTLGHSCSMRVFVCVHSSAL